MSSAVALSDGSLKIPPEIGHGFHEMKRKSYSTENVNMLSNTYYM